MSRAALYGITDKGMLFTLMIHTRRSDCSVCYVSCKGF